MNITRPACMEVSLNDLKINIEQIKKMIGSKVDIMPVVKANAYGTYINNNLDILNEFKIVAVATVDEAVEIRNIGYKKEIFVLNQPYETEIDKIIKNNITIGVCSKEFINKVKKRNLKIHLELETGMGRTGISPYEVKEFLSMLPKNIIVEGIYTHFSCADTDYEYTKKQIKLFDIGLNFAKEVLKEIKYVHACASNGILNFPEAYYNLVRPGIILYGYKASFDTYDKIKIKPIAKLKSKIIFLKEIEKGKKISYGGTYITNKKTKIATVPIGYADGFRRSLSNNFYVIINGEKANIIGNICMDSFMVDVTNIDGVKIGDEVIIWDNERITLEELSSKCGTINYEILCTISSRISRKNTY